jgi:hypothetical protein
MGEMRNTCKIMLGKLEGKRPLGRRRCRWKGYIIMGLTEIGWEGVDWMHLAQDRDQQQALLNTSVNLRVPHKETHFFTR